MLATVNQNWSTFGQVAGDASGALVGLLFVSVSLNRERITKSSILRSLALQTLIVFMLPRLVALLLLTPQSSRILGDEFIALGAIQVMALWLAARGRRMTAEELPSRLARAVLRITATGTTTLFTLLAGLVLVAGYND